MRKVWQRARFPLLIAGATTAGYTVGLLSWLVIQANIERFITFCLNMLLFGALLWSAIAGFFSAIGWYGALGITAMACVVVGAILGSRESRPVVVRKECAAVIKVEQILAEARQRQAREKSDNDEGDFGMFWADLEQEAGEEFWEFTVSRLLYVVQNNPELADPHAEVEPFDAGEFEVSETEQGGEQ